MLVLLGRAPHKQTLGNKGSVEAVLPCPTFTSLLRCNNRVTQAQTSWKYRQALCDRLLIFMQKSKTTEPLLLSIFVLYQLVANGLTH